MREHTAEWGRVGDDGTVYVTTAAGERAVGQWPEGDPEAALAFYERRFAGLEVEVGLLEQRTAAGAISPDDAQQRASRLKQTVSQAQAVGDLDGLLTRLDALAPLIAERRASRAAERAQRADEARAAKSAIADEAENVATRNDWRAGADRMRQLLDDWKVLGRIDKATDDALWHRFSAARTTYTRRRKAHFTEQNEKREAARIVKEQLVGEAEELSASTSWRETSQAYRDLMARWKAAGPAPRAVEDKLWSRFRAAQDAFFGARDAVSAQQDKEFSANADIKRDLLAEAEKLLPVTDPKAARDAFRDIASRWDAAGKVPRAEMKALEGRMRKVENAVRAAEDERWRRSNPEAATRARETVTQLEDLIADLREQRAAAEAAGQTPKVRELSDAISARQTWLDQAQATLAEFSPSPPG